MITIEERITQKVIGETSLFIKFDFNQELVNTIKLYSGCSYSKKTKEWEVPLTYLSRFLDAASKFDQINLKMLKDSKEKSPQKYEIGPFKVQPFDHQLEAIQYGLNHERWLLLDLPGLGKAFELDTPVLTPDGYVPIRDIEVGDTLYDERGEKTTVQAVYNHENLEMYRLTFFDGTSVVCCKDHLWQINYRKTDPHCLTPRGYQKRRMVTAIKTTEWIATHNYRGSKVSIPTVKPIPFEPRSLAIHPYVLGVLLGDGGLSAGSIALTSADAFVLDRFKSLLPDSCLLRKAGGSGYDYIVTATDPKNNPIRKSLSDYGLLGHKSADKFVPKDYKYSSIEDRVELLRGLLDTDGYVSKESHRRGKFYSGTLQFTSTSKQLFEDVCEIVESLGGLVTRHSRQGFYRDSKTGEQVLCQMAYTGTIWIQDPCNLVTLPRKRDRPHPKQFRQCRHIVNIERVANAPGKCLTVDSPSHLYVVKDGIVTHNTMSTVFLAQELQKRDKIKHCLVVCGLNVLKLNWKREIEKFSDLSCTILGSKITSRGNLKIGSVAERAAHLNRPIEEFFVITNVESLRDDRVVDGILNGPNEFGLILVDEVHKCKGMSQQAQGLLKLTKASYKVAMTGTPIISSPLDAYVPLKWLGIERSTQTNFKNYYCTMDGPFGNMVTGYKNMEILQETINKHSLRRTKEILNLPPKIHSVELVEMESSQASFYNDIKKGIKDQVDKVKLTTSSLLALLTRLRQATSCPSMLTTSDIPSAKIDRAVDLAEQLIASGEKVVIFSSFKEATARLGELLKEHHPLVCTGGSSEEEIESAKTQFQQDDIHKVFIATWQKMGTGITLNRSSNVIFIDTPYTAADLEQAEDRCHRIGTKSTVNVYILVTAGTVDERVQEIVERKEALSSYLVDKQITEAGLNSLRKYIEEL